MEEIAQSSKKSLEMVEKLQEENISLDKIKKELEQKVEDIIKIVKQVEDFLSNDDKKNMLNPKRK